MSQLLKNINLIEKYSSKTAFTALHSTSDDTIEEHSDWYSSLDLTEIEVLFVYGIEESCYKYLKNWLNSSEHFLVFVEDDPKILRRFCETEKAFEILSHPRVRLYYWSEMTNLSSLFCGLKIQVSAIPSYLKNKKQRFEILSNHLIQDTVLNDYLIKGDLLYSIVFFKNLYRNIKTLKKALHGNTIFNNFKNKPAIVCGAGPSLKKNIDLLKQLENNALILAGGSSANILGDCGIRPHFILGIDPTPEEYNRFIANNCYENPHVYRMRLHPKAVEAIEGERIYISGGGWYPIEGWIEEQLNIAKGIFDEGYSVTCFAVEYAKALGCSPIIFVGVDLAYTDMKEYPEGLESPSLKEITDIKQNWWGSIKVKDMYGKEAYSKWHWIIESDYISKFQANPNHVFINATEGGLGIEGIQNSTLEEVRDKYLKRQYDWNNLCHINIQSLKRIKFSPSQISLLISKLQKSFKKCHDIYRQMLDEILKFSDDIIKKQETSNSWVDKGKVAMLQVALEEEVAYDMLIKFLEESVDKHLRLQYENAKKNYSGRSQKMELLSIDTLKIELLKQKTQEHIDLLTE